LTAPLIVVPILPFTPNERRVAEDRPVCRAGHGAGRPVCQGTGRRDCYWLYIVTNCNSAAKLQEPIKDPAHFPWHEACLPRAVCVRSCTGRRYALRRRQVKKVEHYYLSVDALTQPMQVSEKPEPYGRRME